MITMQVCIGMFLGLCSQIQHWKYDSMEQCERERERIAKFSGVSYAVCFPTAPKATK